jgi:hypothetical protein
MKYLFFILIFSISPIFASLESMKTEMILRHYIAQEKAQDCFLHGNKNGNWYWLGKVDAYQTCLEMIEKDMKRLSELESTEK